MVNYTGKFVLAPMVRMGELPTRLMALKYGADLVWGPEIIDKKLLMCKRVVNDKLGTVDFLDTTGNAKIPGVTDLVFRTYPQLESNKLIFQMGTANADLAVKAAKIVIGDVSGIDVNAGCPKHFSIHSGMGAALLKTPDILESILVRLVNEVGNVHNKPISVKIRLLESKESSLELISRLLKTGISNLTLHCRTQHMKNRDEPIRDYLPDIITKCREHKVSFIINGSISDRQDFVKLQEKYGEDVGAMVASAAEINPTCFSQTPLPWGKLTKEYIKLAGEFDNSKGNTKFCLTRMVPGKSKFYRSVTQAKTLEDLVEFTTLYDDNGVKLDKETDNKENENPKKRQMDEQEPSHQKKLKSDAT